MTVRALTLEEAGGKTMALVLWAALSSQDHQPADQEVGRQVRVLAADLDCSQGRLVRESGVSAIGPRVHPLLRPLGPALPGVEQHDAVLDILVVPQIVDG